MLAAARLPAWSAHPCAPCHPKEVAGYAVTQMAHSLGPVTPEPGGEFTHSASGTQFSIEARGQSIVQRAQRHGMAAEYEPVYAIGSGKHAVGYLVQRGDHLFQSPICYYSGRGWDMAPGYEKSEAPDFYRVVTPDCLFCHAGQVRPLRGSLNGYEIPPFAAEAISCDRCHGPVEAHLRAPVPGSIVNPAKLPRRARASVCEQCHLAGEARIPNPGKQLSDFRAGEELESVYSVYVSDTSSDPHNPSALRVISQAQQLALSTCARRSGGKLWCGTCHDPHQQPSEPASYFRSRCLSCHGAALVARHAKPNQDCIGCHMPRRPVTDGGHTVFTDHRIARRPPKDQGTAHVEEPKSLVAWHQPPAQFAQRNLGLADVEVGERIKSLNLISQGVKLLMACWPKFPNDPPVLTTIGQVLLGTGDPVEAARLFERAIQLEPDTAAHYLHAGMAWKQANDRNRAIDYFEKTLQVDPVLEEPYRQLADVYSRAQDEVMRRQTYERYLKAFPKSLEAQADLARRSREVSLR